MSDSELIDWEQLSMIFGDEDEELDEDMAELFEEFVEDGLQRLATIKGLAFPDEKSAIAKESHKLKGSASNFGFVKVAGLLGRIENEIESISEADYASSLGQAAELFTTCVEQVKARYPALKA